MKGLILQYLLESWIHNGVVLKSVNKFWVGRRGIVVIRV